MSQEDIGKTIGKAHNSVSGYESGRMRVPPELRDHYAKCLGVSVTEIQWEQHSSHSECEVSVQQPGDFALLTSEELVAILVGRMKRMSEAKGAGRAELAAAVAKIANELSRRGDD